MLSVGEPATGAIALCPGMASPVMAVLWRCLAAALPALQPGHALRLLGNEDSTSGLRAVLITAWRLVELGSSKGASFWFLSSSSVGERLPRTLLKKLGCFAISVAVVP